MNHVSFHYKDGKNILENIDLQIEQGEVVSIIGNNGEGKSTLARIMAGILKPTEGNVTIDGINAYEKKHFKSIRKKVGIVFQNPENQILFNSVYDDIAFALNNLALTDQENRIKDALKKVGMEAYEKENPFQLSLGQKQRINIASVLAVNPKYMILDEPTTMIDANGKQKIYSIMRNLKKEKQTIIFVTNHMNEILLSNRIIILKNKKIDHIIKREELFEKLEELEKLHIQLPDMIQFVKLLQQGGVHINLQEYTLEALSKIIIGKIKNNN